MKKSLSSPVIGWILAGTALMPFLAWGGGCSTAEKDSSGHYQYSEKQLESNREAMRPFNSASQPLTGVAAAAFSDALHGTDPKQPVRYIEGICWMEPMPPAASGEVPCVGFSLVLTEEGAAPNSKSLKTKTESSGRFLFVIDPRAKYSIRVESGDYSSRFEPSEGPYAAGTHIVIHLTKRRP